MEALRSRSSMLVIGSVRWGRTVQAPRYCRVVITRRRFDGATQEAWVAEESDKREGRSLRFGRDPKTERHYFAPRTHIASSPQQKHKREIRIEVRSRSRVPLGKSVSGMEAWQTAEVVQQDR
jgi:hypothetical protein